MAAGRQTAHQFPTPTQVCPTLHAALATGERARRPIVLGPLYELLNQEGRIVLSVLVAGLIARRPRT